MNRLILYSNGRKEDIRALEMLAEAGVTSLRTVGPVNDQQTPFLQYGMWRYDGIKEIRWFVDAWKSGDLHIP